MLEPEELKDSKPDLLFILIMGLLSMLTPLAIDMYLPAFVKIANDLNVSEEMIPQTLALFTLGFAFGQLFPIVMGANLSFSSGLSPQL